MAVRSESGVSCSTSVIRVSRGNVTLPWSASSRPAITANRLDLPEPLAPVRPIRWPGNTSSSTFSNNRRLPRRKERSVIFSMGKTTNSDVAARGGYASCQMTADGEWIMPES